VAVRVAGEKGLRAATATEITRGGLFVRAEPPLPVPFARVEVSLARDGSAPLELHGDVVRVVTPAEAAGSGLPPGFAIQFLSPTPAVRAELERMSGPSRPSPSPAVTGARWLDDLAARAGGSHYDLLGLPPDAEVKDVQSRARSLRVELEGLRQSPLSPQQAARVGPLLARLAVAAGVLGVPAERLDYDARRGNHLGVARCVAAGLPEALVAQHRSDFLRERPGAEATARQCRARARVARALANREAALAHYEEALRADPLDLEVQQEYWQLRRESGEAPR
jgi:serine/threonine-protein kinase